MKNLLPVLILLSIVSTACQKSRDSGRPAAPAPAAEKTNKETPRANGNSDEAQGNAEGGDGETRPQTPGQDPAGSTPATPGPADGKPGAGSGATPAPSPAKPGQTPQATSPQGNPAPSAQPAAVDTRKEGVDYVFIDNDDFNQMAQVIRYYFDAKAGEVTVPVVSEPQSPVRNSSFNGQLSNSEFKIEFAKGEKIEFKNVKLEANKQGEGKSGKYGLIAVCIGGDCSKVFATLFIREGGQFIYNWPLLFKKTASGKYLPAFQKKGERYELKELAEDQNPPQMRVMNLLEAKAQEHGDAVLAELRQRLQKEKAVYSALFFAGMTKPMVETEFKSEQAGVDVQVTAEYLPQAQRAPVKFNGKLDPSAKVLNLANSAAKNSLEVKLIDGTDLILLTLTQDGFKSLLPGETKGISALLCSLIVEKGATFHTCQLVPSSAVLGTIGLEGRFEGPIYVKEGEIIQPKGQI